MEMKHSLKVFCLGAAITIGIGACSGNGSGGSADSSKVDSSSTVTTTTDTLVKTDSARRDTTQLVLDTPKTKADTLTRTVTKKTVATKKVITKP